MPAIFTLTVAVLTRFINLCTFFGKAVHKDLGFRIVILVFLCVPLCYMYGLYGLYGFGGGFWIGNLLFLSAWYWGGGTGVLCGFVSVGTAYLLRFASQDATLDLIKAMEGSAAWDSNHRSAAWEAQRGNPYDVNVLRSATIVMWPYVVVLGLWLFEKVPKLNLTGA